MEQFLNIIGYLVIKIFIQCIERVSIQKFLQDTFKLS
jgi:hypothetical protein